MVVGWWFGWRCNARRLLRAVLPRAQSLASGTFVYVATMEVLSGEFGHSHGTDGGGGGGGSGDDDGGGGGGGRAAARREKRLKFLLVCLGVAAMALLKLLEAEADEDD